MSITVFTFANRCCARARSSQLLGHGVLGDIFDGLLTGGDLVRLVVGDLELKLLLERHDDLNGVEGVEAKVLEGRGEASASARGARGGEGRDPPNLPS